MRLAVVTPRYGADILGGAEAMAREFAEALTARGRAVDVLTTCARDHLTWRNDLAAGLETVNGVRVRRFPVSTEWDTAEFRALTDRLLTGQPLTRAEEYQWVSGWAHSPRLYAFLQRHQAAYDLFLFVPYLAPTTLFGASAVPDRSIIWPCLHNERLARLHPVRLILSTARGLMFNAEPERQLAHTLGIHHPAEAVIGFGLNPTRGDAERFRQAAGWREPFILYSGRLEPPKNVPLLVDYFVKYKRQRGGPLKLVLMGTGPFKPPRHPDIVSLGFRQGQEKLDACAAALALCQPSVNESFSLVIMESWLARVPVLVHTDCPVTHYHARKSNGGLYFRRYGEFAAAVEVLLSQPDLRDRLGDNGRRYVTTNYSWEAVIRRFDQALAIWTGPGVDGKKVKGGGAA